MKNKKYFPIAVLMLFSTITFGQVGINTATPKATFDVMASASDLSKTDGFIAPRLKGSELKAKDALYSTDQDAAIVYVTEALAAADVTDITTNVTSIGYYYFDKTIGAAGRWTKFSYQEPWNVQGGSTPATINTQNIYQLGTVAVNKNVVYDGVTETNEATDTSGKANLDVFGSVRFGARQRGAVGINSLVAGAGNSGSGNNVAVFGGANTSNAGYSLVSGFNNIAGVSGAGGQIITGHNNSLLTGSGQDNAIFGYTNTVSSSTASLTSGSRNTTTASYTFVAGLNNTLSNTASSALGMYNLDFTGAYFTIGSGYSIGGGVPTTRSNAFTVISNNINSNTSIGDTWVAISSNTAVPTRTDSTIKLRVYGGIQTAGASYPDYVFEDYFNGSSKINSSYQFKSLYDTEKYIKDNHHLPGVTSIKDLEKTENGYSFNLTELSTQTLEKVEELYLHTIEQQKQIDELKEMVKIQQEQIKQMMK